jgi:hypothetical protein
MESLAFATLLFVIYFCAACCFFYSSTNSIGLVATSSETDQSSPTDDVENLNQDLWVDPPLTIAEALSADFDPEPELEMSDVQHLEPKLEDLLREIDLDTLQLRPARKICGRLGIQQKVNSKDAPLSWLRSQIKSRLSEKPNEVVPIIQEILKAA